MPNDTMTELSLLPNLARFLLELHLDVFRGRQSVNVLLDAAVQLRLVQLQELLERLRTTIRRLRTVDEMKLFVRHRCEAGRVHFFELNG